MSINIMFPKDDGNILWDGNSHKIEPQKLEIFRYNNEDFYLLSYKDENGKDFYTVLRREGQAFVKVPLRDYEGFEQEFFNYNTHFEEVNINVLNNVSYISTMNPVNSLSDLVNINNNISSVEPMDSLNTPEKSQEQITRDRMLNESLSFFSRAIKWRYGNNIPIEARTIFEILNTLNLNSLSFSEVCSFTRELETGLYYCVTLVNGQYLGATTEISLQRALEVVKDLLKKYFTKKENIISSASPVAKKLPGRPPHDPDFINNKAIKLDRYLLEQYEEVISHSTSHNVLPTIRFNVAAHRDLNDKNLEFKFKIYDYVAQKNRSTNNFVYNPVFGGFEQIIKMYLDERKNIPSIIYNRVCFTLDLDNECYYYGHNYKVKHGAFIEYHIALCDTKEKFKALSYGMDVNIEVPEDSPYINPYLYTHSMDKYGKIFYEGVHGKYTLTTFGQAFEGDEEDRKKIK